MRPSTLLTSVALILSTFTANAGELTPEARLRKMSLRIRGLPPTAAEFKAVQDAESGKRLEDFFERKAAEYTKSRWSDAKLAERLYEDFRLNLLHSDIYGNALNTSGSYTLGDLDAAPVPQPNGRFFQALRYQIQSGHSLNEILANDILIRQFIIDSAEMSLVDLAKKGKPEIERFRTMAEKLGYPMSNETQVEAAILAFRANPKKFNGPLKTPATVEQAARMMADVVRSAPMNENVKDWLEQINDFEKKGESIIAGAPVSFEQYASFLDSAFRSETTTTGGKANLSGYSRKANAIFQFQVDSQHLQSWACAIAFGTTAGDQVRNACGAVSPFLGGIFSDIPLLVKLHAGFFERTNSETRKYVTERYKDLSQWLQKAIYSPLRPDLPPLFSMDEINRRYSKTQYSRAAAFFRIYLCDEMRLVALVDPAKKSQQALTLFELMGQPNGGAMAQKPKGGAPDPHVKGDCVACHRKLDPVKTLIDGTAKGNEALTFVYDDADGKEHRVPLKSSRDFMSTLVAQPQFSRCQTEKLWNWIVGEDVYLSRTKREELIAKFKELKSDPRAMIAHLALQAEFYTDDAFTKPTGLNAVRGTFMKCNSCHSARDDIPSFTDLPITFGGLTPQATQEDHVGYLKRIVKMTDLLNGGEKAKMPPKRAGWSLSDSQRTAILRWIWHGALADNDKPTLSPAERESVLKGASEDLLREISRPLTPVATFRPTWLRFSENYDIAMVLQAKVPLAEPKDCLLSITGNLAGIGIKNINTGAPDSDRPTGAFREVYTRCASGAVNMLRSKARSGDASEMTAYALLGLKTYALNEKRDPKAAWASLAPQSKDAVLEEIVDHYIGPNVLSAEKSQALKRQTLAAIDAYFTGKPTTSVVDAAAAGVYLILNEDEFLTH